MLCTKRAPVHAISFRRAVGYTQPYSITKVVAASRGEITHKCETRPVVRLYSFIIKIQCRPDRQKLSIGFRCCGQVRQPIQRQICRALHRGLHQGHQSCRDLLPCWSEILVCNSDSLVTSCSSPTSRSAARCVSKCHV